VDWSWSQRQPLWIFSHTALWYTPRWPPMVIRSVLVAAPDGNRRMEAFFCPDLEATPVQHLPRIDRRCRVEVTFEETRAHLGLETQW
jgi:hypothetical protein